MATLIPSFSSCAPRMSPGEKLLGKRLEQKLDDEYRIWYDVPIGPKQSRPDFLVLHPKFGILVLEAKHWKLNTIRSANRQSCEILTEEGLKTVANPLEQARHCAIQVIEALRRDPQLVQAEGPYRGKLAFPWAYGTVLSHIDRGQFNAAGLGEAIAPDLVICADEMPESIDPEIFQSRLLRMFRHAFGNPISSTQIDRVRWTLFPDVRVPSQGAFFLESDTALQTPDVMQVMDWHQEQLARSLREGHRVIHGVAGSGKTMILGHRAEFLAKASTPLSKPILVLCFNEPLGVKLDAVFEMKGIADKVHARNFHKWCLQQLRTFGQEIPKQGPSMFDAMVENVINAVERGVIPGGQYQAVLVDEGHDFRPEWLRLATRMVDPASNNFLLLYDDAQSIYEGSRRKQFSFKSMGIQAQGRTSILKVNYRNTTQILQTARWVAGDLLKPEEQDEDGVPLIQPISHGREGASPLVIRVPTPSDEASRIAELMAAARQEGYAWADMAVLCRDYAAMDSCAAALRAKGLPFRVRKRSGDFRPQEDAIKVLTMKVSKGLEFAVVALAGVGQMPAEGEDEQDEARLFYVAATRATEKLFVIVSGEGAFGRKLGV